MSASPDPIVIELAAKSLLEAARKLAIDILEHPEQLKTLDYRRVERLMRIAVALSTQGVEAKLQVQVHGLPPDPDAPFDVPETFRVDPARLLAARKAELLADALNGKPDALVSLEIEAERILLEEDIQIF